jgi:small subunit ribosomal protein S16
LLKIRLSRTGKTKQPSFSIIVQEHSAGVKSGKVVEKVGHYVAVKNPKEFKADAERIKYWISKGAQPSDSLAVILKREGYSDMDKYIASRNKKRKSKKEKSSSAQSQPQA